MKFFFQSVSIKYTFKGIALHMKYFHKILLVWCLIFIAYVSRHYFLEIIDRNTAYKFNLYVTFYISNNFFVTLAFTIYCSTRFLCLQITSYLLRN